MKLKQQLKLIYKASPPKKKEEFFKQIESQIQTKQRASSRFSFLNAKRAIPRIQMRRILSGGWGRLVSDGDKKSHSDRFAYRKWVWATVAMGLLIVSLYPKPSTTEYQPTTSHYTSSCGEHIWICVEEFSLTDGKKYVHAQCINCKKISMTIEDITFGEQSH